MEICKRCKNESTCSVSSESDFCLNYEPRPLTNADRIRQMSDEELALHIGCTHVGEWCPHLDDDVKCVDCRLAWLKKEVEE